MRVSIVCAILALDNECMMYVRVILALGMHARIDLQVLASSRAAVVERASDYAHDRAAAVLVPRHTA